MVNEKLYLIGMPGAGKTTLGRGLATRLEMPFRDLDQEIVEQEGRSIPEIFATDGEAYFRSTEALVLRKLVDTLPRLVLATGGGTPCFHQNMDLLQATGTALYLSVPITELVRRLLKASRSRPLLAAIPDEKALLTHLTETLAFREQFYAQAPLRCEGTCTVEAVLQLLTRYHSTG
jgi:shikimate kinase